ncbi:MAG: hypothetical protein KDA21_10745 [Phycisphaerales bacterium]|nr:hypothetical protein [Phycisphaerales bacterium]
MGAVLDRPGSCLIRHESLCADPERWIRVLERAAGVEGIDRGVLERRFNGWEGYVEPAGLSEAEEALVRELTAPALARLGGIPEASAATE